MSSDQIGKNDICSSVRSFFDSFQPHSHFTSASTPPLSSNTSNRFSTVDIVVVLRSTADCSSDGQLLAVACFSLARSACIVFGRQYHQALQKISGASRPADNISVPFMQHPQTPGPSSPRTHCTRSQLFVLRSTRQSLPPANRLCSLNIHKAANTQTWRCHWIRQPFSAMLASTHTTS